MLNALRETESALTVYARQLDRESALQAAREQSAQAASQARQLFQYGKTDYLTVLDAERTLAANESALAAARRTQQRPDRRVPGAGRRLGGRGEPDRRH